MIFVMGGTYGRMDKYRRMLEKLNLKDDDDSLFVLGNIIADGKDGIAILKDMMFRQNIFPVLGEHEYFAKKFFPMLQNAKDVQSCVSVIDEESKYEFARWLKNGGYPAIEGFLALDDEGRESIIDYLGEFEPYEEIEAGGKAFVLAHAGISGFDEEKALEDYEESAFVFEKADYSKIYFKHKYLITGHTQTADIPGGNFGRVFSAKRHLAIDCGVQCGGKLAAVCLDTMKVYYC